jgi:hypothetical protein
MNLFRGTLLIFVLFTINGCSGNNTLESLFAPNPSLKNSVGNLKNSNSSQNKSVNNQIKPLTLPANFPNDIPIYKSSKLIFKDNKSTTWVSDDPLNLINNYYKEQLVEQKWDLKTKNDNLIIATKVTENRILNLSFTVEKQQTKFVITEEKEIINSTSNANQNNNSNNIVDVTDDSSLQQLMRLNILSTPDKLDAYQTISRREYARWLFKTNNILYANTNSKLIRLANPQSKPIFADVSNNDPDFMIIQGLAEAGLIPSSLTQDPTAIAFNPDKPLTREDLISWKVPLDFRQKLPNATLDSIKETWGFQDVNQTKPQVWAKLYVDWQNGEHANIRKAFGYITLFQPQKTVTYGEAAAVVSSFGYQGDIVLLKEVN